MIQIETVSISAVMRMPGLTAGDKTVYSAAMLEPESTTVSLCEILGKGSGMVSRHCSRLRKAGLVRLVRVGHAFKVLPLIPLEAEKALAAELTERVGFSGYLGEAQSFGWLDTLVWDPDYLDCFRPGFVRNPLTGRPLEYDRVYPKHRVATEFQGPQHYRLTRMYPNEDELADTRFRDLVKLGLSHEKGIEVIILEPKDLSLKGMLAKIGNLLPLRPYNPEGPLVTTLERLGRRYNGIMARQEQEAEMKARHVAERHSAAVSEL